MCEQAVRGVLSKLDELATSHNLDSTLLGGDPRQPLSDRDKYIGHESQAAAFELAAQLLRDALPRG